MKNKRYLKIIYAIVCAGLSVHAETVYLNETFKGTDRAVENLPQSAAWFSATEGSHITQNTAVGTMTLAASETASRHVISYFREAGELPVELEVDEVLVLEYSVILTNPVHTEALSNSFRVGIFNSGGAARVSGDGLGGVSTNNNPSWYDGYEGYRFDLIPHTNTSTAPLRVFRREGETDGAALLTINTDYTSPLASAGVAADYPTGLYHGEIRITRVAENEISFIHRIYSASSSVAIDMTVTGSESGDDIVKAFDTLAFGINSRVADSFTLYQVKVSVIEIERVEITVGSRTLTTSKFSANGTPVVPMWTAPMASENQSNGAGFPILTNAEHTLVWQPPTREDGAYNHYAALINYKGRFFAMWGNHPLGEDGPGQRILFSYSDEWGVWSEPVELFAPPGPVKPRTESGIHLKSDRWVIVDDTLYAVVYVHGAGIYPIARSVSLDAEFGEPFPVRSPSSSTQLPEYMQDATVPQVLAAKIRVWYTQNDQISWWARSGEGVPGRGVDGATLIESFSYRATDGTLVMFARDWGHNSNPVHNNRLYVSFNDGSGWGTPYPTDIPDSPSRAEALTIEDGTVLLIGNQIVPRFDTALYLDRDPLTVSISRDGYTFDRVYALRADGPKGFRFGGVAGRNPGFAYLSSIVHDGWLYSFYSIGKEDMGISRVKLSEMGLPEEPVPESVFLDVEELESGWKFSSWLEYVWDNHYPFVYTPGYGWLYIHSSAEADVYAYHQDFGWFYTGSELHPFLYVYGNQKWYCVDTATRNPAEFWEYPDKNKVTADEVGSI